jgi:hypothetical protein
MASSGTCLASLALVGLITGNGIGVSRELQGAIGIYKSLDILSGVIQGRYGNYSPAVIALLLLLPAFMHGGTPGGIELPGGANGDLVGAVLAAAVLLAAVGPEKFASYMGQAAAYAATTFAIQGIMAACRGQEFNDMGFQFNNCQDVATGGITNQFDADLTKQIGAEMPNLGTMFSVRDMSQLSNPGTLVKNLIDQGLINTGMLGTKLTDLGMDLNNLPNENSTAIMGVMATIIGTDFLEIVGITNFKPYKLQEMHSLADVFRIDLVFSPAVSSKIPTFAVLANKLGNIGGNFGSFTDVGAFYSSVETTPYPRLNALPRPLPDSLNLDLTPHLGAGTGVFGQPILTDIIGSAAGIGYTDNIRNVANTQRDLVNNDSDVRGLHQYLLANEQPNELVLAGLVAAVITKPELQPTLNDANKQYINMSTQYANEQRNQSIAGLQFGANAPTGSMLGVMSLGQQIPGFAVDPMQLGLGHQLANMATDDVYGDAIQSSLQESRNLNRMQVFGINPGTKMDPMAYSNLLRGMTG